MPLSLTLLPALTWICFLPYPDMQAIYYYAEQENNPYTRAALTMLSSSTLRDQADVARKCDADHVGAYNLICLHVVSAPSGQVLRPTTSSVVDTYE
jgi:hypothetical protein